MALRKDWQAAKSVAEDTFKKEHPLGKDPHINPPTPYPLKFKLDLGPTLDDFEKAKKPEDKAKYIKKAKDIIKTYRASIQSEKEMKGAAKILTDMLNRIDGQLK